MDSTKVSVPQETKLHFLDYWRIIRIRKTVILAVFLLVAITATLVTFMLPEAFSSTARIRVQRDQSDIAEFSNPSGLMQGSYDPYFIQTEFEVISSEAVLGKVVDELKLVDVLTKKAGGQPVSRHDTINYLRKSTNLRPERNTSIISISVVHEDPNEAARWAEAVAKAYTDYRLAEQQKLTQGGIQALEDYVKSKEADVRKAQKRVDDLREELQIPDMIANESTPTPTLSGEVLRRMEGMRMESQTELARQNTLLETLRSLSPQQLEQTIPIVRPDPLLTGYMQQRGLAEQELVRLKKEYGPEHSEIIKISAQVADLNEKIKASVEGILLALDTTVNSLRVAQENLEKTVLEYQQRDIQLSAKSRPYFDAKRDLQDLQRIQQQIGYKLAFEKTDISLPKTSIVKIIDHAVADKKPVRPNKILNISLGIIIGLVVGIGLAFFIEYLDTSVKTIDDVERSLGSPVLGVIPQNVGLLIEEGAESPHAEAYRVLRTNLLFSRKDDKLNTIAVVSAGAGEGKSTTVFNLAAVFAQSGQRVIVVDSDLRRPRLHKMLHVTNNIGLTNYLLKQNTIEEVIQTTKLPSLDFMASGRLPSSSLGILSSSKMKELITELKQHYDYVLFDSPPVMGVSDASVLASEVDMTIQVIQYRRYPQPMNIRAKQLIEKVGGNLVGIVLNNINMSQDESYYYYSGYYHEYYSRNDDQEPAAAQSAGSSENSKELKS